MRKKWFLVLYLVTTIVLLQGLTFTVGSLASLEHFLLAATGGPLGVDTEAIIRAMLGIDAESGTLDVNADRRLNAADVIFNVSPGTP